MIHVQPAVKPAAFAVRHRGGGDQFNAGDFGSFDSAFEKPLIAIVMSCLDQVDMFPKIRPRDPARVIIPPMRLILSLCLLAPVAMEKRFVDSSDWAFPDPGERIALELTSVDKRENFALDVTRARIRLTKLHARIGLAR